MLLPTRWKLEYQKGCGCAIGVTCPAKLGGERPVLAPAKMHIRMKGVHDGRYGRRLVGGRGTETNENLKTFRRHGRILEQTLQCSVPVPRLGSKRNSNRLLPDCVVFVVIFRRLDVLQ